MLTRGLHQCISNGGYIMVGAEHLTARQDGGLEKFWGPLTVGFFSRRSSIVSVPTNESSDDYS